MPKKANLFEHYVWIEARKRWRIRTKIGTEHHDITGKTKDEVDEKYTAMVEAYENGLVLKNNVTVVNYAREWFNIKKPTLSLYSVKMYRNIINSHIAPFFTNTQLADVKPISIEKLLSSKSELSNSLQSKILITLNQIMNSAENNGYIIKNPCRGIKAGGRKPQRITPLTKEQQKQLITNVTNDNARLFIMLCLYAGLRKEESLGLLWSNVHLEGQPYIDVRHTVKFDNDRPLHTDELKSKAAYRSIPIPKILSNELKKARCNRKSLFVIHAPKSKGIMSDSSYRNMWDYITGYTYTTKKKDPNGNLIKKHVAGVIDFPVHAHLLRHTYITELCASGIDIKKIQYLAGHENVNMTMNIYTHVKDNSPDMLYDLISKTFP